MQMRKMPTSEKNETAPAKHSNYEDRNGTPTEACRKCSGGFWCLIILPASNKIFPMKEASQKTELLKVRALTPKVQEADKK